MLVGIVGKPSAGKSTFFKALTLQDVAIAAYPFTTIKPNEGASFVRVQCIDKEFNTQCNPREGFCKNGTRFVPVKLLDVAGLVPGAHEGKGLGLQFLDDLRQADALIHVVDMSGTTNEKGEATTGYDPSFDVRFLETEIDMWMLGILKKGWERAARQCQQEKKHPSIALGKQLSGLNITEKMVEEEMRKLDLSAEMPTSWSDDQLLHLTRALRQRTKPIIIAGNKMDLPDAKLNYERLKSQFPEYLIVPCSAETELALKEATKKDLIDYTPGEKDFTEKGGLNDAQKDALDYMRQNVLTKYGSTGVQDVIDTAVFKLLNYIAIFPGGVGKLGDQFGNILPDCFVLPGNITALGFAAKIHTDLAAHFVAAIDVRSKRRIGKDTPLKHRDVVEILTSK